MSDPSSQIKIPEVTCSLSIQEAAEAIQHDHDNSCDTFERLRAASLAARRLLLDPVGSSCVRVLFDETRLKHSSFVGAEPCLAKRKSEWMSSILQFFVVQGLGGTPVPHTADPTSVVWDITASKLDPEDDKYQTQQHQQQHPPQQTEQQRANNNDAYLIANANCSGEGATGATNSDVSAVSHVARSHTADAFNMHTDSSFEVPPPRYIAMACVTGDAGGGGKSLLVRTADVLEQLPPECRRALRQPWFRFAIPYEFQKDESTSFIVAPVLFGDNLIRYRDECVRVVDHLPPVDAQRAAVSLDTLQRVLTTLETTVGASDTAGKIGVKRTEFTIEENSLLFFDNSRFFHGRTSVVDIRRHLLRVRFQVDDKLG